MCLKDVNYSVFIFYFYINSATDVSGLSSTATLSITVTDVNDVVPSFTSNTSFIVLQTAATGDYIMLYVILKSYMIYKQLTQSNVYDIEMSCR